jgi:LPS sulfotransferase NodH
MLARHAREARAHARQRSRAPRRSCKPRHVLLVALPTSLAGLVGLWRYTSIARRRPTTTVVLSAAAVPLPAVVPFVVLFESSSGSSWLMQELSALPEVCAIGFEPIDNISMASAADHTQRLRWLRTLWTPQRASASEWLDWQAALQRASVFGQDDAIRRSLARCRRADAVAYGLKARLSRLLSDEPSMVRVAALMAEQGVRVVRLSRRNVIKQALAEYRRLHAGLGQFRRRGANASIPSIEVELRLFKRALQVRWLSHTRNHARTTMHTRYLNDDRLEPRFLFTCPRLL